MADITLRLIWYRLGEGYKNLGDRAERFLEWYEDFSWRRVDILDMLFLGWLLAAFLVVGAINLYLRFFGLPRSRKGLAGDDWRAGSGGQVGTTPVPGGEPCEWLNSAISWLYLHFNHTPELVEAWLRALNEQARKATHGELQLKFERIQSGSLPPRITKVSTDTSSQNTVTVLATLETRDSTLLVSALQNTATSVKVTNCDVTITHLLGQLRIHGQYSNEEIQVTAAFLAPPLLNLSVKTRDYDSTVDTKKLEAIISSTLRDAVIHVCLPTTGGYPNYYTSGLRPDSITPFSASAPETPSPIPEDVEPVEEEENAVHAGKPQERRLLVKVIKANGLGDKDFGCTDPYCVVQLDYPPQKHTTSVVKNTVNPFWDEHFLFDIDDTSRQVKFDVFDREKPPGEDNLGGAFLNMEELRRLPSSRQIIPLTGRPRATTSTSGSITIEFLFMDATQAQNLGMTTQPTSDAISPRRRVETSRQAMPGGTIITTTTTTTEKPRDQRIDPFFSDSPNRVEKADMTLSAHSDYSPYSSRASSHLGAHDAALSASQVNPGARNMGISPTFTVTGPNVHTMSMTESPPEDHRHDTLSMSTTTSSDPKGEAKKKSFASTLKKRFARPKKTRSHSADARAHSFREQALLKPPETADPGTQSLTAEDLDRAQMKDGTLRKTRSHSFSNSFKKLFKKKKKGDSSRESSLSRGGPGSREHSVTTETPQLSYRDTDRQLAVGPDRYVDPYTDNYQYSTSVPANRSPLYS